MRRRRGAACAPKSKLLFLILSWCPQKSPVLKISWSHSTFELTYFCSCFTSVRDISKSLWQCWRPDLIYWSLDNTHNLELLSVSQITRLPFDTLDWSDFKPLLSDSVRFGLQAYEDADFEFGLGFTVLLKTFRDSDRRSSCFASNSAELGFGKFVDLLKR